VRRYRGKAKGIEERERAASGRERTVHVQEKLEQLGEEYGASDVDKLRVFLEPRIKENEKMCSE